MTPISPSILPSNRTDRWALIAALGAVFLGAVDLTVIATILPRMVFDLEINTADVDRYIWVVNAYLLAYIVSIPLMGRVSDLIGRTAAFEIALLVFLAGSVWSAVAGDLRELIAARAVQGAGGGALLPVTMALVADLLPEGKRLTALGAVGAVDTLGWVLGPIWGAAVVGALGGHESWRWVFWSNLPVGVFVAIAVAFTGRRQTHHQRPPNHRLRRLDLPGTILLGAGLLLLNLGLSAGAEVGLTQGSAMRALGGTKNPLAGDLLPLLGGAVIALAAFVLWERRTAYPIVSPALFRSRPFLTGIVVNFLVGAALIVAVVDVPVTIALIVDQDRISTVSAYLLAPFTVSMAALSFVGGIVANRFSGRTSAAIGLLLVTAGYVALWFGLRDDHYLRMVPGLAIAGTGFGLLVAPVAAQVIDAAKAADRGVAASFTILFRLLGMTIGISTLTALGVRRLQTLTDRLDPIVQQTGESTAEYFVRQNRYIEDVAIPLSLKVVRETFLVAAVIALVAIVPVMMFRTASRSNQPPETAARNAATASETD
jgi:MFS family permease